MVGWPNSSAFSMNSATPRKSMDCATLLSRLLSNVDSIVVTLVCRKFGGSRRSTLSTTIVVTLICRKLGGSRRSTLSTVHERHQCKLRNDQLFSVTLSFFCFFPFFSCSSFLTDATHALCRAASASSFFSSRFFSKWFANFH